MKSAKAQKSARILSREVEELKKAIRALEEDLGSARGTNERLLTQLEEAGRVAEESAKIQAELETTNAKLREQVTILRGEKEELIESSRHIENTARIYHNDSLRLKEQLEAAFSISVVMAAVALGMKEAGSTQETAMTIFEVAKEFGYDRGTIGSQLPEVLKVASVKMMPMVVAAAHEGADSLPLFDGSIKRREAAVEALNRQILKGIETLRKIDETENVVKTVYKQNK